MYKTTNQGLPTPSANIAINRSRIKLYGKNSKVPTYYLQKGQEFQIELFNPTKDTIMAKISLNGKPIAQGGLVLKPAQRVFLDRYIDVAKKFKFDTYEVANTSESRKAIEDNGDFRVEFYKEQQPQVFWGNTLTVNNTGYNHPLIGNTTTNVNYNTTLTTNTGGIVGSSASGNVRGITGNLEVNSLSDAQPIVNASTGEVTLDFLSFDSTPDVLRRMTPIDEPKEKSTKKRLKSKKSIETGRVEAGSHSDQTLTTVYMNWEYTPFHTIEYKMMPISQKVNTVQSISVKRYCTSCGNKQKPNFKFCPTCGTQV